MIPATRPYVARYEHKSANGSRSYFSELPVAAWDNEGYPLVVRSDSHCLERANTWRNFAGIDTADSPVVAAVPGGGWRVEHTQEDGAVWSEPIVAWAIYPNGTAQAITVDGDGYADELVQRDGEWHVYHPSTAEPSVAPQPPRPDDRERWFHRGPCCGPCSNCGADEGCLVYNDDIHPEIHTCAKGCQCAPECTVHHSENQ